MSARALVAGEGVGRALVLSEPLSLWGGLDPATGTIVDVHHPQLGRTVTGRVLVMRSGRGSSSSSSVLAEAIRLGTAPAAIILREPDPILALGAIVARELFGRTIPVLTSDRPLRDGEPLRVVATSAKAEIARDRHYLGDTSAE